MYANLGAAATAHTDLTNVNYPHKMGAAFFTRVECSAARRARGACFAQCGFGDQADAAAHIPEQRRGILGNLPAKRLAGLRARLAKRSR